MFSVMAFIFLAFFGIALVLFYMMRVSGQRHEILRGELLKTQDMLRTLETRLPAPDRAGLNATVLGRAMQDDACPPPDRVTESPLTMPETGAPPKKGVFDPALDLHFDSAADNKH
ncbi:MAG: hypothetical protein LBQ10_10605 [Desulfovibrio sp.]|jgi:hypothetical protein|nr:hypothetical protein [Desulfovibrio sp.]